MQDLIATWLPHLILLVVAVMIVCMIYDPTMKLLIFAALPESYQNWLTFAICLVEEARFLMICAGLGAPSWQLQIVAFQDINEELGALIQSVAET